MGLDIVELVMALEEEFELEISNEEASRLATVGDVYWYVRRRLEPSLASATSGDAVPMEDPLWRRVVDLVEKETGVARKRLVPSARFVQDLGLD